MSSAKNGGNQLSKAEETSVSLTSFSEKDWQELFWSQVRFIHVFQSNFEAHCSV